MMIWGFISYDGRKGIAMVSGNLNAGYYTKISEEHLLPNMYLGQTLQQDNAPAHRSILTKNWMFENGFQENWPAQSPDQNIIENLWDMLKRRVKAKNPRNIGELCATCKEEFEEISVDKIQKFYESIPARLSEFIRKGGKNTKY